MSKQTCGRLYVISGPSGSGKTSLSKALIAKIPQLFLSISYTTRPPRSQEIAGQSYHFVEEAVFLQMQEHGDFIESAQVFQYWYGTSRDCVRQQLEAGQDVLLEIDWQGAQQVKKIFPQAKLVFILPTSPAILLQRLRERQEDTESVIAERVEEAKIEVAHYKEFDFLIENDSFEEALAQLICIVQAERLKVKTLSLAQKRKVAAFLE